MDNQYVTDPQQRREAAAALSRIVELDWPEGRKGQLPTLLLRALCDLTASPESQSDEGWEPLAIAQEMRNLGAHWPALTEEDARLRINNHWKSLERLWGDRSESVGVRLSGDGFDLEPRLKKLTGGGAGNRTRYRLRFYPVPASVRLGSDTQADGVEQQSLSVVSTPIQDTRVGERAAASIRYYAVPMRLVGSDKQDPIYGFMISDRKLSLYVVGLSVLIILATSVVPELAGNKSFHFTSQDRLFDDDVALWTAVKLFGTVCVLILVAWWFKLRANLVRVVRIGITAKANLLFELHDNPDDRRKQRLHILSYVADCPICGADGSGRSSIRPASGGWEFHGRIVGRCDHAPQEHVWSFDHITRTGRFLR